MYVIIVYDISNNKRGAKMLKFLRTKLLWIQNSVFEGEVTEAEWRIIKDTAEKIIKRNQDSIIYYLFESLKYYKRGVIGIEKGSTDSFI